MVVMMEKSMERTDGFDPNMGQKGEQKDGGRLGFYKTLLKFPLPDTAKDCNINYLFKIRQKVSM